MMPSSVMLKTSSLTGPFAATLPCCGIDKIILSDWYNCTSLNYRVKETSQSVSVCPLSFLFALLWFHGNCSTAFILRSLRDFPSILFQWLHLSVDDGVVSFGMNAVLYRAVVQCYAEVAFHVGSNPVFIARVDRPCELVAITACQRNAFNHLTCTAAAEL